MKKEQRIAQYAMGMAVLVTIINLLIFNDVASYWSSIELPVLVQSAGDILSSNLAPLPTRFIHFLDAQPNADSFLLRLPAGLAVILILGSLYFLGRRIFGEAAAKMATFVAACSWAILFFGKLVGADSWMVLAQVLQVLGTIYFIKQPKLEWAVLANTAFFIGLCILPWPMLLSGIGLGLFYFVFHPKGKNLLQLIYIVPMILSVLIVMISGGYQWMNSGLQMGWPNGRVLQFLGYNIIGLLPWLAFFIPALWDSFKKIKKREELSIIYLGWLLAAVLSGTGLLQIIMAIMIGRHVLFYFQKNYPYQAQVRGIVVTHFILAFFAMFGLIMLAGLHFEGAGYRAALTVAIVYWGGSLVSVVSVFSKNSRNLIGSLGVASMLGFLMFWLNVFPLWESRRGWDKLMVENAVQYRSPDTDRLLFFGKEKLETPSLAYYAKMNKLKFESNTVENIPSVVTKSGDLVVLPKEKVLENKKLLIVRDSFVYFPDMFGVSEGYYVGKWR